MYTYNGTEERTYLAIVDNATGRSLVAEPGKSYDLDADPADGLWSASTVAPAPAPEAPQTAPEAPVAPATTDTAPTTTN